MFGMDITLLAFIGLVTMAAGGIGYGVLYNKIASDNKTSKRVKSIKATGARTTEKTNARTDAALRRKGIEETLKTADLKHNSDRGADNPPLSVKLTQASLTISVSQFYTYSAGLGLVAAIAAVIGGFPIYAGLGVGLFAAVVIPMYVVSFLRGRRQKKFILEFPTAVDIIVRGIKSGLPLNDCLRIIANESNEPVRSEFQKIVEAQQLGLTLSESVARLATSIPVSEAKFFSIVIAIQASAGGNLAEALNNLSKVLRERKKMKDKIAALSMEAKASSWIIGSLPILVGGMVYVTSPDYLSLLFTDPTGQMLLAGSAVWMGIGIYVMKIMINFDF